MDAGHFTVHIEDLGFVQAEAFNAVLVGVGVERFLEGLAQQVLAALGVGQVLVDSQHEVVGHEAVRGGEEAEAALDDGALVPR